MSRSDRNLRNRDRIDYREPTEESVEDLFDESTNDSLPVQNASDPTGLSAAADLTDTEQFQHTAVAEVSVLTSSTPVRTHTVVPDLSLEGSPVLSDDTVPPASPLETFPSVDEDLCYATAVSSQSGEEAGGDVEVDTLLEQPAEVVAPAAVGEPAEVGLLGFEEAEMAVVEVRKTVAACCSLFRLTN